jgi:hypothetical protein
MLDYFIRHSLEKVPENSQTFGTTGKVKSYSLSATAFTHTIVVVIPDFTNDVTTVLSIENADDHEIYASGSLAKNTTHVLAAEKPLVGNNTIKLTLSGDAGGSCGIVKTKLYLH